jgi:hypothetical protein
MKAKPLIRSRPRVKHAKRHNDAGPRAAHKTPRHPRRKK